MIASNALQRTFQLRFAGIMGTCFTIDVDDRQYLCTAKHCVKSYTCGPIDLFHDKKWKAVDVELVGYGTENTDIAILAPTKQLSPSHPLPADHKNLILGQDVYFLGFPFGLRSEAGELNRQFPLPLVKRATVSAMWFFDGPQRVLLLDGHNNPGFSGGPVVFAPAGKPATQPRVAAVVSAFRYHAQPVLLHDKETELAIRENTGIIITYAIEHAVEAIKSNPIGAKIVA